MHSQRKWQNPKAQEVYDVSWAHIAKLFRTFGDNSTRHTRFTFTERITARVDGDALFTKNIAFNSSATRVLNWSVSFALAKDVLKKRTIH
jgi:hypothetical protein